MKSTLLILALLFALPFSVQSQSLKTLNKPILADLDQVTPFQEGMAAVRRGNQWGFIDTVGNLVIDFRDDLVWNENPDAKDRGVLAVPYPRFRDGRCMFQALGDDDIPVYGFIDQEGKTVIPAEYLNLTEFQDGYAVGILVRKTFRGQNRFQLNIFEYSFMEGVLNPEGEMAWPIAERENILMQKRRYEMPGLTASLMGNELLAVETAPGQWEIRRMKLQPAIPQS